MTKNNLYQIYIEFVNEVLSHKSEMPQCLFIYGDFIQDSYDPIHELQNDKKFNIDDIKSDKPFKTLKKISHHDLVDDLMKVAIRKPQSEITNAIYELANDRLKTSSEAYIEFCKYFHLPKTEEGQDWFRRYKQSGSGLANIVKYFEAQYHKEHYTEIPNFYDNDYDEG